ncbi:MAG: hypothetical protein HYU84_10540 [Chloroflexi bacterium]|nr:hypothetical protein [Chloroflexota bacterium]MBI3167470.1 hypothetical protein [Chloroflexota bacterium]
MKRPFLVTLSIWLVLILASWNALQAWTAIAWQDVLTEFSVQMPPTVSAVVGVFWFIIGLILAWGIWQKKVWSMKMLLGAAAGYTVWIWSERLIWQNPRPNVPFAVIANLVCLIVIYFASKSFSREAYERNTENPAIE